MTFANTVVSILISEWNGLEWNPNICSINPHIVSILISEWNGLEFQFETSGFADVARFNPNF